MAAAIREIIINPEGADAAAEIPGEADEQIHVLVEGDVPSSFLILPTFSRMWSVRRLKIAIWELVCPDEQVRAAPWRTDYRHVASVNFCGTSVDDNITLEQMGLFDNDRRHWRAVVKT